MELKKISLSYSIVFIWKNQFNELPHLSKEFAENIFEEPIPGNFSIGRDGINVIYPIRTLSEVPIVPNVEITALAPNFHIGFERLVLLHNNLDILCVAYEKLYKELGNLGFLSKLIPRIMGINTECEIPYDGGSALEHLNKRFNSPKENKTFSSSSFSGISLSLTESIGNGKAVNISIEPRVNSKNAIYFKVNDHYNQLDDNEFLSIERVREYFKSTDIKFTNDILPFLNLLDYAE